MNFTMSSSDNFSGHNLAGHSFANHDSPNPQSWPMKMDRKQLAEKAARNKAFAEALERQTDSGVWLYDCASIARNYDGWYIANMPSLAYRSGAVMNLTLKPMAVDTVFWGILGFPVKDQQSLFMRNRRVWTLLPKPYEGYIGHDVTCVETLARLTLQWTKDWCDIHKARFNLDHMLDQLGTPEQLSGEQRILAICLLILQEKYGAAQSLCTINTRQNSGLKDDGGFTFKNGDGRSFSFFDQAGEWLVKQRRKTLQLVD